MREKRGLNEKADEDEEEKKCDITEVEEIEKEYRR